MRTYVFAALDRDGHHVFVRIEEAPTLEVAYRQAKAQAAQEGWTDVHPTGNTIDDAQLRQLYRRYQRYDNLAKHYRTVLEGLPSAALTADPAHQTVTFHTSVFRYVPKSIPRGKPVDWYRQQYNYYAGKASDARDVYWGLHEAEEKRVWAALDREGKLALLRDVTTRLQHTKASIQEYRAKIPAWEHQCAERGPVRTDEEQIRAWMHSFSNPHPMIETLETAKQEMEEERDWLLAHL